MTIKQIKAGNVIHDIAALYDSNGKIILDTYYVGTSIPNNSDLDTYTTVGKYYMGSESGAQTLINCPTTTNFAMYVITRTSSNILTQIIIGLNGRMYVRSKSSTGWRNWSTYATTADVENVLSSCMDLTSDQTATGIKTFTNGINIGNAFLHWSDDDNALVFSFNTEE